LAQVLLPCSPPFFSCRGCRSTSLLGMVKTHHKGSKRITLKLKYTIQKKCRVHKRRQRKEAKKLRKAGVIVKKGKKDPGVPNSWPEKEQLLREIQRKKEENEKERLAAKEEAKKLAREARAERKSQGREADKTFAEEFAKKKKQRKVDLVAERAKTALRQRIEHLKHLNRLIDAADVVVEVVDARDPQTTRCPELEKQILAKGKKVVVLLNKMDLAPKAALQSWLKVIRKEVPAFCFKSTPLEMGVKLDDPRGLPVMGNAVLLEALNAIATSEHKAINVAVIGYPNVGRRTLLRSFQPEELALGKKIVRPLLEVESDQGSEGPIKDLSITERVSLLMSPGTICSGGDNDPENVLRNASRLEFVSDPIAAVGKLMEKVPETVLMRHFNLPKFSTPTEFLKQIAKSRGKVRKGTPDLFQSSRAVLLDWTTGKVPYFTSPAEEASDGKAPAYLSALGLKDVVEKAEEKLEKLQVKYVGFKVNPGLPGAAPVEEQPPPEEKSDDEEEGEESTGDDEVQELGSGEEDDEEDSEGEDDDEEEEGSEEGEEAEDEEAEKEAAAGQPEGKKGKAAKQDAGTKRGAADKKPEAKKAKKAKKAQEGDYDIKTDFFR